MTKTSAAQDQNGRPVYVTEGAVRQQGTKKMYVCNTCHRDVVWLESKRTGKFYLADVYRGDVVLYYVSKPHNCRPIETFRTEAPVLSEQDQKLADLNTEFIYKRITFDEYLGKVAELESGQRNIFAEPLGD